MSVGLLEQLRIYGEDFEAGLPPVTLDELENALSKPVGTGAVRPLQPSRSIRPVRVWLVVAAAALAVLVLVGGAALFLQAPGSNTPVATTPPAQTTSTTFVEAPAAASTWSRVPGSASGFGTGRINGVTVGGPGLVAVGSSVWTSVDGITWTRVPDDPTLDDAEMHSVTAGGPGLVAVGEDGQGAGVWTSVDGIAWTRVPHDQATFGRNPDRPPEMWDVTVGGPGLVAVGVDWSDGDADAAVWTSVDGLTWTRVPHDEAVFGGNMHQAISDVTAAGTGLVAVGVERSARMQAVIWTSVDGLTWERVARDESGSLDRGEMKSVAVGDSGLVAVGWIGWVGGANSEAAVWTSVDGIDWSRVPHDDETIGSGLMWSLTNTDRGLVAVGSDGTDGAVWVEATEN